MLPRDLDTTRKARNDGYKVQKGMDEKKVVIELQDVHRDFRVGEETVHALRGVSFKIYEGEFVTIMANQAPASLLCLTSWAVLTLRAAANIILTGYPCAR